MQGGCCCFTACTSKNATHVTGAFNNQGCMICLQKKNNGRNHSAIKKTSTHT